MVTASPLGINGIMCKTHINICSPKIQFSSRLIQMTELMAASFLFISKECISVIKQQYHVNVPCTHKNGHFKIYSERI